LGHPAAGAPKKAALFEKKEARFEKNDALFEKNAAGFQKAARKAKPAADKFTGLAPAWLVVTAFLIYRPHLQPLPLRGGEWLWGNFC
jgi:hypothetical protein